jgi:hypothetical protein
MENKWDNILKTRECLSPDELKSYQSGILSHDKKLDIERHLIDCDFCSDALEGYQTTATDLPLGKKKNLKWLYFTVAAAVLLLFILAPFSEEEKTDLLASNDQSPKVELSAKDKENERIKANSKETVQSSYSEDIDNYLDNNNTTASTESNVQKEKETITANLKPSKSFASTPSETKKESELIADDNYETEEDLEEKVVEEELVETSNTSDELMKEDLSFDDSFTDSISNIEGEVDKSSNEEIATSCELETIVYKKSLISKKLGNGRKTKQRKELKEEEIDYDALQDDYGLIQESDFQFDSLSPTERDSIGLILDEKRFEYEFSVGKELYEQKDYVQALEHLEKVIGSYGGNAYAIYLTARSYQEIEKYEKANKLFKALYETDDVNTREKSLLNSAFCFWKLNNGKKAIKILDGMILKNSTLIKEAQELKKQINND